MIYKSKNKVFFSGSYPYRVKITVTLRNIWFHGNDIIFNNTFTNPDFLLQRSQEKLENFHSTNEKSHTDSALQKHAKHWKLLTDHFFKVNWNGAVDTARKNTRIKIVIRDSKWEVLACLSPSQPFYSQPIIVECLTLWLTTEFYLALALRNVILKGDAQVVVNAIKQEEQGWSWYRGMIVDLKFIICL